VLPKRVSQCSGLDSLVDRTVAQATGCGCQMGSVMSLMDANETLGLVLKLGYGTFTACCPRLQSLRSEERV